MKTDELMIGGVYTLRIGAQVWFNATYRGLRSDMLCEWEVEGWPTIYLDPRQQRWAAFRPTVRTVTYG